MTRERGLETFALPCEESSIRLSVKNLHTLLSTPDYLREYLPLAETPDGRRLLWKEGGDLRRRGKDLTRAVRRRMLSEGGAEAEAYVKAARILGELGEGAEGLQTDISRELSDRLLRPWLPSLGEGTRLIVIPDGPLHFLPFGLLEDEGGKPLRQKHEIVLNHSASAWLSLRERERRRGEDRVFCMGNATGARRLGSTRSAIASS